MQFIHPGGNLNMGKSDISSGTNLADLYGDIFAIVLFLRETSDFGDPKILHDKIDLMLKNIEGKTKQLGIPDEDILDAKYAVSALIDETVLYSSWTLRNVWLNNPLVVEYFNDALAGEVFFDRVERIRTDGSKLKLLEVYYMCLMFGFEGRYKIIGPEELKAYINGIREQLGYKSAERLSPHSDPQKIAIKKKSMIPKWIMYASYGFIALAAIVIFIVLKVKMVSLASFLADGISKMGL
jgi:type VI secretion system protein ImpK